jgi:hypothetical protein
MIIKFTSSVLNNKILSKTVTEPIDCLVYNLTSFGRLKGKRNHESRILTKPCVITAMIPINFLNGDLKNKIECDVYMNTY